MAVSAAASRPLKTERASGREAVSKGEAIPPWPPPLPPPPPPPACPRANRNQDQKRDWKRGCRIPRPRLLLRPRPCRRNRHQHHDHHQHRHLHRTLPRASKRCWRGAGGGPARVRRRPSADDPAATAVAAAPAAPAAVDSREARRSPTSTARRCRFDRRRYHRGHGGSPSAPEPAPSPASWSSNPGGCFAPLPGPDPPPPSQKRRHHHRHRHREPAGQLQQQWTMKTTRLFLEPRRRVRRSPPFSSRFLRRRRRGWDWIRVAGLPTCFWWSDCPRGTEKSRSRSDRDNKRSCGVRALKDSGIKGWGALCCAHLSAVASGRSSRGLRIRPEKETVEGQVPVQVPVVLLVFPVVRCAQALIVRLVLRLTE